MIAAALSLLAAFILGEPIGLNLVFGIAAVLAGIWVAKPTGQAVKALRVTAGRNPRSARYESLLPSVIFGETTRTHLLTNYYRWQFSLEHGETSHPGRLKYQS